MLGVGGSFKALSAVAFFFAWKFYKLPCKVQTEGVGRQDSSPSDVASQITLVDGNDIDKEKKETELTPVAQFITVSNTSNEKLKPVITSFRKTTVV